MKKVLSIAGSDCSGGAGIQADIKTMLANGVYAMSAITALTAQNTLGVSAVLDVDANFLEDQLDSIFTDIYPDAIKIGMVSQVSLIKSIAKKLKEYKATNVVLDPVMVATSGAKLISDDAISVLQEYLFPLASIITPNIPEAEVLAGMSIENNTDIDKEYGKNLKLNSLASFCISVVDTNFIDVFSPDFNFISLSSIIKELLLLFKLAFILLSSCNLLKFF